MNVGVMKDYKLRDLHASHTLGWSYLSAPKNLVESWFTFPGTKIFQFVFFPQFLDLSLNKIINARSESSSKAPERGGDSRRGQLNSWDKKEDDKAYLTLTETPESKNGGHFGSGQE